MVRLWRGAHSTDRDVRLTNAPIVVGWFAALTDFRNDATGRRAARNHADEPTERRR